MGGAIERKRRVNNSKHGKGRDGKAGKREREGHHPSLCESSLLICMWQQHTLPHTHLPKKRNANGEKREKEAEEKSFLKLFLQVFHASEWALSFE